MLIYCDSVVLIYWLDGTGPFRHRAALRITALQSSGDQIAISDLTRLECRVRPLPGVQCPRLARRLYRRSHPCRSRCHLCLVFRRSSIMRRRALILAALVGAVALLTTDSLFVTSSAQPGKVDPPAGPAAHAA